MTDISQKTWRYLHGADDTIHLSFKTDGVPRSFSVVQYTAIEDMKPGNSEMEIDFNRDGIAVIDNDHLSVVLDGHLKGSSMRQADFMSAARKMDWDSFSRLCVNHPRFRNNSEDLGAPLPKPGVLVNQIQRGVMNAPKNEDDIRSPSMVAAHVDPGCPYSFPERTRTEMISDLLEHSCLKDDHGSWRIAWETHLDADAHGAAPHDETASDWKSHFKANPEIFHQISVEILEPFFSGRIATWPPTDSGRYGFTSGGAGNSETICLDDIDGADVGFSSKGEMGRFLNSLPDNAVRDVWKLVQIVDRDLSKEVVDLAFSEKIRDARKEFETSRDTSPTPGDADL